MSIAEKDMQRWERLADLARRVRASRETLADYEMVHQRRAASLQAAIDKDVAEIAALEAELKAEQQAVVS